MMKCKASVQCIINSAEFEFGGDSPLPVCAPQMWRLATTLKKSAQATVGIDHSVVTTFFSLKPVFHVFYSSMFIILKETFCICGIFIVNYVKY